MNLEIFVSVLYIEIYQIFHLKTELKYWYVLNDINKLKIEVSFSQQFYQIYLTISTFTFVRPYAIPPGPITLPIPAVVSQDVTTKSCFLCVKSEKFAFLVTLRHLESTRQVEVELFTLPYYVR